MVRTREARIGNSRSSASLSLMTDDGRSFEVVSELSDSFGPAIVLLALGSDSGELVCNIVGDSLVLAVRALVFRFSCNGDRANKGGLVNPEDTDEVDCRRP